MKLSILCAAASAVALLASASAASATEFNFNWHDTTTGADGGASASGVFDATDNGSGVFTVTGVTGVQTLNSISSNITGLSTYGSADQKLFTTGAEPLDFNGISYNTETLGAFNIGFVNGNGLMRGSEVQNPSGTIEGAHDITFSATAGAVPEPASWALMIMGFGGVGAMLRSGKRRSQLQTASAA
jgi:opacity protein-like surface antigen